MNKRTIILGGGTTERVKEHLSLSAPAYGTIAKALHHELGGELVLTKMADFNSKLESSDDVREYIDTLLEDKTVGTIIMSCAICDFKGDVLINEGNSLAKRLDSSKSHIMQLTPTEKIIREIRIKRPDIFLVAFKTTVGVSEKIQFARGLKMMKDNKANLVLANDTETRNNIIIVPEENYYKTDNREDAIAKLVDCINKRSNLTYKSSNWDEHHNFTAPLSDTFIEVLQWLIDNGAYKLNQNGFSVGHFGYKKVKRDRLVQGERERVDYIYSSQRKGNHNRVLEDGFTRITLYNKDELQEMWSEGELKPSVGATSQALLFETYPEYDCIVHFHCGLKEGSEVNIRQQWAYQCGSEECSVNTADGIRDYNGIKAVHLHKHGPNIMFNSNMKSEDVIKFIEDNWKIGEIE